MAHKHVQTILEKKDHAMLRMISLNRDITLQHLLRLIIKEYLEFDEAQTKED